MKTIQHFKKLYDIVKDEGIVSALKHDAIETAKRHPQLVMGASLLYSSMFSNPQDVPIDSGYAEATIDSKTGEYLRFARREANSDTTFIEERKADGSWEKHSYTPVKLPDGSWETKVDLPRVYQLKLG